MSGTSESTSGISNDQKWAILMMKTQEKRCADAVTLFREHGIEPILIKGMAAARFYPQSKPRVSIDVDLAVPSSDHKRAEAIAVSHAASGMAIDIHNELRHMDTLPWHNLFANSTLIQLGGIHVRVLRPEDHLRVLCVHWLTDGGVDVERLYDIYYHIANRAPDFDWTRFLELVSVKRRRWLECAAGMAERDLGLDLTDTPLAGAAARLPKWLTQSIDDARRRGRDLPLESAMFNMRSLVRELHRRLRPNPIYATIQMEGDFDAWSRVPYQLANFFSRVPSSLNRVLSTVRNRNL